MTPDRFSVLLALVCLVGAWQIGEIPASPIYSVVDAGLVPKLVLGVLAVCVVLYGHRAFRGREVDVALEEEHSALPGGPRRALYFLGGLLGFMVFIKPLGFVLSATFAGIGIARAFDADSLLKSLAVCLLISLGFWLLFDRVLSVKLGPLLPML